MGQYTKHWTLREEVFHPLLPEEILAPYWWLLLTLKGKSLQLTPVLIVGLLGLCPVLPCGDRADGFPKP